MIWKDRIEQYPHRYTLTPVSGSTYDFAKVTGAVAEEGTPVNAENLNKLIQRDGDDIKDTVVSFTEADTRENIATGEKTSTIFGKIKKWFTDLKEHAFNDLATAPGAETDKAPTNKLLNDTAALKVDKTSISTVMPISSAAASNDKVLGEKVVYDEFAKTAVYDKIIKTQTEFEALIASPTWFDAKSVALVGQFTLSTANNNGIKIPATVKQIHGFNGAKITVTNFVYNESTANGGLWYDTRPTTLDYSIRDLEVDCTGTGIETGTGFFSCTNLTNCTGTGTGGNGYGFHTCTNLMNCTGKGTGIDDGIGFHTCSNLTNCTGTGIGTGGYGFIDITTASNCTDGGSSTAMWVGTNKNIDLDTCCKTPVAADNTTLNTYKSIDDLRGINVSVLTSAWAADATYAAYPYRAAVTVTGLTENHTGIINFNDTALALGTLKDGAKTYAGGFYIYASAVPSATVTIESYVFWEV